MIATSKNQSSIYCLHHLFEEQVRKTPDAIAIQVGETGTSYHELNRLSNQLANYLSRFVIMPNRTIGMYVYPSLEMAIAVLGILKAGGACVAIDFTQNQSLIKKRLEYTNTSIFLSQQVYKSYIPFDNVNLLYLDDYSQWQSNQIADNNPISPTTPSNLACVAYAENTTPNSKPIFISHKNIKGNIDPLLKYEYDSDEIITLQHHAMHSRQFYQELFSTWCSGGTLAVMPLPLRNCESYFWRFIQQNEITRIIIKQNHLLNLIQAYKTLSTKCTNNIESKHNILREIILPNETAPISSIVYSFFEKMDNKCKLIMIT